MLTEAKIKSLSPKTKPYKIADVDGLFLVIYPSGGKHWRLKYRFAGREKSLSLGRYPDISLLSVREITQKTRGLIRDNLDPSLKKQSDKKALAFKHDNTFGGIAKQWYETNREEWTPKHAVKIWRRLEMHVLPSLGKMPIAEIKPLDILSELRRIESRGSTETTHRLLWMCSRIFKYAVITGATDNNPALNIGEGLKTNRGGSFPVIRVSELPAFLKSFEQVEARQQDKFAFKLLLLTALRTGELRHCKWSDIHISSSDLRVRKEVMKMGEEHIVPLSRQAIEVLRELYPISGHQEWLFPNPCPVKHPVMSENVINLIIEEMGYKTKIVGHSFRKLFSTVLNEQEFPADAIERQLAHRDRGKVRGIYNHALYLKTRRYLMQWWADYLDAIQVDLFAQAPRHNAGYPLPATPPLLGLSPPA